MWGRRELASASCRIAETAGCLEGVPDEMKQGIRVVLDVNASNPRKGHATKLMHQVSKEADRAGITLLLEARAFQDGMTSDQLIKWYTKFGFIEIPSEGDSIIMARQVQQ
jgi:GNAT superfamily N-acetyltransferase